MLFGLLLVSLSAPASANGQTTHSWISMHALDHLPPGELRDLLTREDLEPYLLNGTMFPDGGYAVGDDYGERAHWEPFQSAYLRWIRDHHDAPYDDEGAQHVAFLMGLASHGLADQVFDAMYMERSKTHDAAYGWAEGESMDEATDVIYALLVGPREPPEEWFPGELFVTLYAETQGYTVDEQTMSEGMFWLSVAIAGVGALSEQEEMVAEYERQFPWASAYLTDPLIPGSPPCEGALVAQYWQVLWARLQGEDGFGPTPYLGNAPADGTMGWPTIADHPDALVHVVVSRGLSRDAVSDSSVTVTDGAGLTVPVSVRLFYGEASHVLNIAPAEGAWAADTDFTVEVPAGLLSFDGASLDSAHRFTFSTRPPPVVEPDPVKETGGGCGGAAGVVLLGLGVSRRRGRRAHSAAASGKV
ncbi:zinc dependent phospholipase C family protein [Myxococcota bacterium]|nr:zinc dependent phospholipase C family protein [Myxococcota bacterium]